MRIVIGEDSALFREGLARPTDRRRARGRGEGAGRDRARPARSPRPTPDLAIIDIRMPPDHTDDGARAARQLRAEHPSSSASCCSPSTWRPATRSTWSPCGGFGYLLKDRVLDVDDFLDALRRVAAGGSALDPGDRQPADRRPARRRPTRLPHHTRARGARADGRGPHQRRHRPPALADRPYGRDPCQLIDEQAGTDHIGRGPPAGAGRAGLPQSAIA